MKRILAATDLSARSDRAIDRAILLARQFGAALTILHVIDEDLPTSVGDRQRQAAEANLREHIAALAGAGGVAIELSVQFGKDWIEILRQAEALRAELVVLGLHRERSLQDLFRGTTVERAIRNGNVPVLVVKERAQRGYRSIVVGIDFSVYSRRAVDFALRLSPEAEVYLVHAYDIPFSSFRADSRSDPEVRAREEAAITQMIDDQLSGFLAGLEGDMDRIGKRLKEGEPDAVIAAQVADLGADLLVLGTHGRTGVAHAFLGSVAEGFLTEPPCDVAAVKAW